MPCSASRYREPFSWKVAEYFCSVSNICVSKGLLAEVHSRTTAELFWTRPGTPGLSYEVRRNGDFVAQTDGVSYFDNSLSGGTSYDYQIVAIDVLGNRSNPASVSVTTR